MILVDNKSITNPYINLAIEEYLVRELDCPDEGMLLLYINEPCIVSGKNQSIYKEVNFEFLRSGQLKLARRISGGGTVYQDMGNLNFAFIAKFSEDRVNNYGYFNQPVVNALKKAGVEAEMDDRNNIMCNGKKISGNAQFTNRKNIISHGTLLFDADLPMLRASLKQNEFSIETKAVGSNPKSVTNILDLTTRFNSIAAFKDYLSVELTTGMYEFTNSQWDSIQKARVDKFQSYAWIYGRSPLTKIVKNGYEIEVVDGYIKTITTGDRKTSDAVAFLAGVKYEYQSIKEALENVPHASSLLASVF